jgi:hypothetical protein
MSTFWRRKEKKEGKMTDDSGGDETDAVTLKGR